MNRLSITCACALAMMISVLSADADDMAYITTRSSGFGTLDLTTGAFTFLGVSGPTLAGLGETNGTLYGASFSRPGSFTPATLYTINPLNGSLTTVGTSSVGFNDFGSTTTGLYAVGLDWNLYSINSATAAATLIGPTGLNFAPSFQGISTNSSLLYFTNSTNLYTLNTLTGAATLVGSTGGPQFGGLVMASGILYGGEDTPGTRMDMLNLVTGAATTGPGITNNSDLPFGLAPFLSPVSGVPEGGSTLGLLAMIGFGLLCARRMVRA